MISYCVAAYRPTYTRMLVADLVWKTSVPYEVLLWVNTDDPGLEEFLAETMERHPVRVVGRTPHNVGMRAYQHLFSAARYPLITQIDDDVTCVSPRIAETAARLFAAFPRVRQLVADVWQDEYTTGARPPLAAYRCVEAAEGLYDGPLDGWFSIYHESIRPLLLTLPYSEYCGLGAIVRQRLAGQGLQGLLCTHMKVFHTIGPEYASLFGMLDDEIEKYRRLGRAEIVEWYTKARLQLPPRELLAARFEAASRDVDGLDPR